MSRLENIRGAIVSLLAALEDGAQVAEGVTVRVTPGTKIVIGRSDGKQPRAVLTFDPPPELAARRGPFHLRCTATALTIGPDEVHLAIDGWFDRRWRVES